MKKYMKLTAAALAAAITLSLTACGGGAGSSGSTATDSGSAATSATGEEAALGGEEVTIKFAFSKVPGSHQVTCAHKLTFTRPTADGKAGEEITRKTTLHVGKYGKLSLVPESQMSMLTRDGQPA